MITINNDESTQQETEKLPKTSLYCPSTEHNEQLKLEMTPLQDNTILGESTAVTITSDQPPVRDHIIWSLFNTMYMNFCCLGLIALLFSVKSRDQKLIGNQSGARKHGATAHSLNVASTVLTILGCIISMSIIYINYLYLKAAIKNLFGM
ncbi:interferon-induced transmembrane protein 1-like [Pseudophryne corroboree]|uniref:interferon-induced transmembrane protein 1-like n=1 Tax=Pseudophryne corroboree TaxID=495146 RepID=UPI003081C7B3